jgi:ribonuclease PH
VNVPCSTIGVKDLDMNSQTHKNGALITASYNMTSQAEVNRTGKSELSSSILQE